MRSVSKSKHTYKIVVGDFNYRGIDWVKGCCTTNEESKDFKFLEAVRDTYFHQHTNQPTGGRGTDDPSLLDLVFINYEDIIPPPTH